MAKQIEFLKDEKINSAEYKKGETLRVSDGIADKLEAQGIVKIVKDKVPTKEK